MYWITDEETEPSQALKNTSQEKPKDKKNVRNLPKHHTSLINIFSISHLVYLEITHITPSF